MAMIDAAASTTPRVTLEHALREVASRAGELDRNPRFPIESFDLLSAAGVPQLAATRAVCGLARESALVRALACADASCGRILDGHFNGTERLALLAAPALRARELELVARGRLLLGVWGADPAAGEGPPASLATVRDGAMTLRGVKTFCSGAGGVQRALVIARDASGARRLAYVDVTDHTLIDRSWYRASGLRSSESHRVEFHDTPVLALLGGEDEIMREPWFSRDAVRTAATWAGIADCILAASVNAVSVSPHDELRLHALGRMRVAQATIDRWLEHALARLGDLDRAVDHLDCGDEHRRESATTLAAECRVALADAARVIAAEAARACGSRALVGEGPLDRARRDLDLFLLQHRLDPKLVALGARTLRADPR
jgi:alkylation response protein AidB-like acyl-CoA dehydrogenase